MQDLFYFDSPIPKNGLPLFDSHAHLQYDEYKEDLNEVIQRAKDAGLKYIFCVGTNIEDSYKAIDLAKQYPQYIYAIIGNHPYHADLSVQQYYELIESNQDYIVGVGETGLDNFKSPITEEIQIDSFHKHCQLAKKFDLPIILHLRDFFTTYPIAKKILLEHKLKKAVFHCYTGDYKHAQEIWSFGWKTSFSLITFYPKNQHILEAYNNCPPQNLLLETDSPYLPPSHLRGQRNEPGYLGGGSINSVI